MRLLVIVEQHLVEPPIGDEEFGYQRLREQGDLRRGEQCAQAAQSRLTHHRIADPIRRPHQKTVDHRVLHDA